MNIRKSIIILTTFIVCFIVYVFFHKTYVTSDLPKTIGVAIDRSDIVEPTIKTGKYNIDDDRNIYFEVLPNNKIKLCGDDDAIFSLFASKYPRYGKDITHDEYEMIERFVKSDIEFWQHPKEYTVFTMSYPDLFITVIGVKLIYDDKGNIITASGPIYVDENTIEYVSHKFILA